MQQFGAMNRFRNIHNENADEISNIENKFNKKMNLAVTMSSFLSNILFFVILLIGMFLFFDGKITMGYMVAAVNLSNFVITPCKVISQQYASIRATKNVRNNIENIMGEQETKGGEDIADIYRIVWNHVGFQYEESDSKILQGVTMTWEKNDKIAILGKSGSGKSTLIKIFCKYFENYKGTIQVDGNELREISKESFCEKIGIISQNPYIFTDTLKNNICLFESFSDEEISEALIKAGIYEYIQELPLGLDTVLIENGKNLSGGQAQRVAIARAVIRKKNILLVDEGTSGLDVDTADNIMKNLFALQGTLIMITHDIHGNYMNQFNKKYNLVDGVVSLLS